MYNNESTNINYKLYINNKIKFKHYDIYDKLKKYNIKLYLKYIIIYGFIYYR